MSINTDTPDFLPCCPSSSRRPPAGPIRADTDSPTPMGQLDDRRPPQRRVQLQAAGRGCDEAGTGAAHESAVCGGLLVSPFGVEGGRTTESAGVAGSITTSAATLPGASFCRSTLSPQAPKQNSATNKRPRTSRRISLPAGGFFIGLVSCLAPLSASLLCGGGATLPKALRLGGPCILFTRKPEAWRRHESQAALQSECTSPHARPATSTEGCPKTESRRLTQPPPMPHHLRLIFIVSGGSLLSCQQGSKSATCLNAEATSWLGLGRAAQLTLWWR